MKSILTNLYTHQKLSKTDAKEILVNISKGEYNDAQLASFLTVFLMRDITTEELEGFRDALLELRVPIDLEGRETIDIVGTGGDGKNTFNISTTSAFVVAGAGYPVSKHGNYGVSSKSGSSNVLESLGYEFTNDEAVLKKQLDTAGICFFHAPFFHPAMKAVGPVRKQLGLKTFFNMLGPLVNPAQPKYQLYGVFSLQLARLYQYILQKSEKQFAVVYSLDGYDEISLTGPFNIRTHFNEQMLHPEDIGMKTIAPETLHNGGSVASAAKIFVNILSGKGTSEQNAAVLANSAAAIQCIKPHLSLEEGMAEAKEALDSGKALQVLKKLV